MSRIRRALIALTLACCAGLGAQSVGVRPAPERPYVVLVSLDGFRYDYPERYETPNLRAIGESGAAAEGLIPSFPSVTFPNRMLVPVAYHFLHTYVRKDGSRTGGNA